MAASSTIQIVIDAVDNATAKINQAVGGIKGAIGSATQSMKDWANENKIASTIIGGSLAYIGKQAIDTAADFERAGVMTKFLTKNTEEANKFSEALIQMAVTTPYTTKQITDLGTRMVGQVQDVGLSTQMMYALTNATSATGGTVRELENAQRALTQTFIKSKPSLEELNRQFNNANIPVMRVLAEELSKGTVKLKGYTDGVITAGGASKEVTKAWQSASEQLPILTKRSEAAEMKLKALKDAGKENTASFKTAEATVMSYHQKLDKAQASIGAYGSAVTAGTKTAAAGFHKSTEEIMSDLQGIADLGVTGKDTAIAIMESLSIKYKGANEAMLSTFQGTSANIRDQIEVISSSILGIDKTLGVREGSIFYYLKKGAQGLSDFLVAHRYDISDFVDSIIKNKAALIGIAAVFLTLLAPAILFALSLFGPFIATALLIGGAFFVIANAASYLIDQFGGINAVLEKMKPVITTIGNIFQSIATLIKQAWSTVQPYVEKVLNFLIKNKDYVLGALAGIALVIVAALVPAFIAWAIAAASAAIATLAAIAPIVLIGAAIGIAAVFIIKHWEEIKIVVGAVVDWFQALPERIGQIITSVINWFAQLPTMIKTFLGNLFFEWIPYAVGFLAGFLIGAIASLIANVILFFVDLAQKVPQKFEELKIGVINKITATWAWISTEVPQWPGRFAEFIKELVKKTVEQLKELGKAFIEGLLNGPNAVWKTVTDFKDKVVGAFNAVIDAVGRAIEAVKKGFKAGVGAGTGGQVTFQHGGIVPGPIGAPMPIIAHGGERITPQGGVDVNERTLGGMGGGGGVTVNINGSITMDSEERVRQLANMIMRMLGRESELSRYGVGYSFV